MELSRIDEMISSEDSSLRREAASLLVDIDADEAFKRLEILIQDRNNGVRDAAQNTIVLLGGRTAIKKMIPLLTVEDPGIRNVAIDILRKIGGDGVDILNDIARDPNDNIRLFVLDILGTIRSSESLQTLIDGLYDVNPNVRNAAAISLGELGDGKAFEHLKKLINDEEWIRFSVIESLAKIPHEGVVAFLLEELSRRTDDEITMCAILETLGKIGEQTSVRPLIGMLENAQGYVELSIAQTLLRIMSVEDITGLARNDRDLIKGILESNLPDADDESQHDMLVTLGRIGDTASSRCIVELARKVEPDQAPEKWEDLVSALVDLNDKALMVELLDSDEKSRLLASEILGRIGSEQEGQEIAARVLPAQGYVKRAMTDALGLIGGKRARETLLKLIHDQDGHVITSSLKALGRIGDPDDIDEIGPFLDHAYPDVRGIALDAIAEIGGEKAEAWFMSLVRNTEPRIRIMALAGLEKTASSRLPEAAAYTLRDRDWEVRMAAVKITKTAGLPIEKDLLMALLNDEHDEIRHLAIDIVGIRKIHELRSFLEDAIMNDEMWTSYHAIEALGQFRDEDAKSRLLSILRSGPDFLRISAVKTLGEWGEEDLAQELEVYIDDDNLDVARAAAEAMDKLQGVAF